MRFLAVVPMVFLFAGCLSSRAPVLSGGEEPIERGWIDRAVLERPDHMVFKTAYDTVHVRVPFVAMMKGLVTDVETIVFLGTWCSDSRREVPRFLKTADALNIPESRVKLFALDRTKTSPDGTSGKYDIQRVPTFIFLKGGKEIGRIVESPKASLEEDMFSILAKSGAE